LEGEIHLGPDLHPSCSLKSFRIEVIALLALLNIRWIMATDFSQQYTVELLALETANFKPEVPPGQERKGDDVVASKPVDITTLYRQGEPVPTAYSEPPERYFRQRVSPEKGAMN
jgi:hypothetical protein